MSKQDQQKLRAQSETARSSTKLRQIADNALRIGDRALAEVAAEEAQKAKIESRPPTDPVADERYIYRRSRVVLPGDHPG